MNKIQKMANILFFLLLLIYITPSFAADAGKTIFVLGKVEIVTISGEKIKLRKGSSINQGDTIISSKRGQAQIKMSDGTLLAIRPNSRFKIDDYEYNGDKNSDKSIYSLMKGGFRSITGKIGKENKSAYGVKTVVGTIGIRGTDYTARLCESDCNNADDGLYVSVLDGGVILKNDGGSLDVSPGEYGYILDQAVQPGYLESAPGDLLFASVSNQSKSSQSNTQQSLVSSAAENVKSIDSSSSDLSTNAVNLAVNTTTGDNLITTTTKEALTSVDETTNNQINEETVLVDSTPAEVVEPPTEDISSTELTVVLPSAGSALYSVIANSDPTDGVSTGTLDIAQTALTVNFVDATASAMITAEFNSETWSSNTTTAMTIASDGTFQGNTAVDIAPQFGFSRSGSGSVSGTLGGDSEAMISAPSNVNMNYQMNDGTTTLNGTADLSVSEVTP